MDLYGKRLLLMGGSAFAQSISKYATEQGIKLIAVGNVEDSPYKLIADKAFMIDTHDVDSVVEIVRQERCDGVFVGASEANIPSAITVSERAGIHFYTDRRLWELFSNKRAFKELLKTYDIEVTKEFSISNDMRGGEVSQIEFPVIVKPVDSSGARGISVCNNDKELTEGLLVAREASPTDSVIIEKYVTGMDDMFIHYTIIDGEISLSCTFDRHLNFSQGGYTGMAVAYNYPSIYTRQYVNKIDAKMKRAMRDVGLVNGTINIQCFTNGEEFYFYESGYRLGGEQMYFFTEKLTGINVFNLIINQALTGKMADSTEILKHDTPFFSKPCLSYYVPLRPGIVSELRGVEELRGLNGVLNVTEFCHVGDVITKDGSLSQVGLRMHLMKNSIEELKQLVSKVNTILKIYDTEGNDMMLEKFDLSQIPYYKKYSTQN